MIIGKGFTFLLDQSRALEEHQSFIKIDAEPIKIHISTESLKPLMTFFKSFSNNNQGKSENQGSSKQAEMGPESVPVKDYEMIMDCIFYNENKKNNDLIKR